MGSEMFNPHAGIPLYVQSGDGKMYREVPRSDGEFDYEPADLGLAYHELPDGKFVAVRDTEEAIRQRESSSHKQFFDGLAKSDDPKVVRRTLKKQEALQKQFERLAIDMVVPPTMPEVKQVKDGEFERFTSMYLQAVREGRQRECEFQPLQSYANKLVTSSGKVVRPLFKGEIGMIGSTILVLEAGYGTGSFAQVPSEVTRGGLAVVDSRSGSGESNDRGGDVHGGASSEPVCGEESGHSNP